MLWQWVKVKGAQLCPTLCNPTDCTVHGILQARMLEWVAFPFSRGSSQPRNRTQVSHIAGGGYLVVYSSEFTLKGGTFILANYVEVSLTVTIRLFVTPWTVACSAPLSTEFFRQEYWSGLPFPSPEDFSDPEMEPRSSALQADSFTV